MLSKLTARRYSSICSSWPDDPNERYLEVLDEYNKRAGDLRDREDYLAPGFAVIGGISDLTGRYENGGLLMFLGTMDDFGCWWRVARSVESLNTIGCADAAKVLERGSVFYASHKTDGEEWLRLDEEFEVHYDAIVERACEYFQGNALAFVASGADGQPNQPCDEETYREHMNAFVNAFVAPIRRQRWLDLLASRTKDLPANSSDLYTHLDRRRCSEVSEPEQLNDSDTGMFCDLSAHSAPLIVTACQAVYLATERDSLFSITPGKLAVYFSHEGAILICRK